MKSLKGVSARLVVASTALALAVLLAATPAHAQFRGVHGSGGSRSYGGGGRSYAGGAHMYGGGTRYYGGGTRYYGGGARYYGGGYRYYPGRRYFYRRPALRVGIGFGFGYGPYYDPWYYPVPYPVYEPAPVVHEVVINDAPPDGCYYYDAFCGQRFSSLDAYLDHLDTHNHDAFLEVIDRQSGDRVHIYEYSNRNWRVRDDLTREGERDDRDNYNRDDRDTRDRDDSRDPKDDRDGQ